jgi:copper chaperone
MRMKLQISGMSCQHCLRRVEAALQGLAGVSSAQVDLEGGFALVDLSSPLSEQTLRQAIADAGYQLTASEAL